MSHKSKSCIAIEADKVCYASSCARLSPTMANKVKANLTPVDLPGHRGWGLSGPVVLP